MKLLSQSRRLIGYGLLGVLVPCLEALAANMAGDPIPLGVPFFGLTLLVAAGFALVVTLIDKGLRGLFPGIDWVWYGLSGGIWVGNAYLFGLLGTPWPWLLVLGLLTARLMPWARASGREGAGLFLVSVLLSPAGLGSLGVVEGSTAVGAAVVILVLPVMVVMLLRGFERFLIPRLTRRWWKWGGVCLVILLTSITAIHWVRVTGRGTFETRFRGTLPEVHLTENGRVDRLPNIVLISIDTLRWDLVPPRAPERISLPHLEEFRRDSVVFPRHFSTSSATLRSHASLFSGLLPPLHGAGRGGWRIHPDVWLYPQLLDELGYHTGGFVGGGWVSRKLGFSRGYDRYWEYPPGHEEMVPGGLRLLEALAWALDRGFLLRVRRKGMGGDYLRSFDVTVGRALEWVRSVRRRSRGRPFFLFLHTYQVHDYKRIYPDALDRVRDNHPELIDAPFVEEVIEKGRGRMLEALNRVMRPPGLRHFLEQLEPEDRARHRRNVEGLTEAQHAVLDRNLETLDVTRSLGELDLSRRKRRRALIQVKGWLIRLLKLQHHLYRYGMEGVDRALGRLLGALKRDGLYEDALIVLWSDHGEGFREDSTASGHGHGQLHEVLVRTPLFVKLPQQKRRGYRGEQLVQVTDVFPSLFHYLGLRPAVPPRTSPDRPRVDLFTHEDSSPRRTVRGLIGPRRKASRPNMFVRTASHKLIKSRNESRRGWYRVGTEDFTERPVPEDEVPRSDRRLLEREMARYLLMQRREPSPSGDTEPPSDPELRRTLEGLGYLE